MSDKITLRDAFGQPFEVPAEEGPGGTLIPLQKVQVSGSTLAEATKTEADLVGDTITFSAPVGVLEIQNDDLENTGTFTVNGIGVTLKPGYGLGPTHFGGVPSAVVTVTGSTRFTLNRYE